MKHKIGEEVSVISYFDAKQKKTVLYKLIWRNKDFLLGKVDNYHTYMEGQDKQHIFELCDYDTTLWFRLKLNASNLHWILEATHDGLAD